MRSFEELRAKRVPLRIAVNTRGSLMELATRTMIEAYEAGTAPAYEVYALGLKHKHLPEIMKYTGLTRRPIFIPSVGNFRQGIQNAAGGLRMYKRDEVDVGCGIQCCSEGAD